MGMQVPSLQAEMEKDSDIFALIFFALVFISVLNKSIVWEEFFFFKILNCAIFLPFSTSDFKKTLSCCKR